MPVKVVEEQEWEDEAYYSDSSSLEGHSRSPPYSELNHSIPSEEEDHPDDVNIAPAHMATTGGNNNASRANNNARPSSAPQTNAWGA